MNPLGIAIHAVVPIFLLIALGIAARKLNVIGAEFVNQASRFVFRISLPVLIFSKVASIDLYQNFDASQVALMIFCFFAIILAYFISRAVGKFVIREPHNSRGYELGAFIQGAFRSNYLIVGYPVLLNLYGDQIVLNVVLLTLIIIPTSNVLSIIALTPKNQNRGLETYIKLGINIIKNPLIIAIVLGFLSATIGLELAKDYPSVLVQFINRTAGLATPLGLVSIGAFFHFESFYEMLKPTIAATAVKLILIPFFIGSIAYAFGMEPMDIIMLCVILGGPTAVSSFAMSNDMGGDALLAGNIVILSSAICILTYIAMITILLSVTA